MKENKSRYILYFIVSIIIVLFRISCTTNLDKYGLVHRPVSYGLIVSGLQTFTDGFIGSMLCLLLLGVNLLYVLYYMRKQGMTDKTKLNFIFLTFGLSPRWRERPARVKILISTSGTLAPAKGLFRSFVARQKDRTKSRDVSTSLHYGRHGKRLPRYTTFPSQ